MAHRIAILLNKPQSKKRFYVIITDEPQGITIGFKPSDEDLKKFGATAEESGELTDAGGDIVWWGPDGKVVARPGSGPNGDISQEDINAGYTPYGPDMEVWRTPKEFTDYVDNYVGDD